MSKLLISDVHARDSGSYSKLVEPLKKKNLQSVFDQRKEIDDQIIITGDFFDKPDPSHYLVNQYAEIFKSLGEHISKVVFIVGNHDPIFRSESAISAFAKGTQINEAGMVVITGNYFWKDEKYKSVYCAWTKDKLPEAPAPDWDLFGHFQINDWIKFSNDGIDLDNVKNLGFKRVYLGDFHPFVIYNTGEVVSIGLFGASHFGDEGLQSGYIIANDDGSFVRHIHEGYPVFKVFDFNVPDDFGSHKLWQVVPDRVKNNIVKVKVHGADKYLTDTNIEEVRKAFLEFAPMHLTVEKVYQHGDVKHEKKQLVSMTELMERHLNQWPEAAKIEYVKLLQQEEQTR